MNRKLSSKRLKLLKTKRQASCHSHSYFRTMYKLTVTNPESIRKVMMMMLTAMKMCMPDPHILLVTQTSELII